MSARCGHPHRAAVNDRPWHVFPTYKRARAYVAKLIRHPADSGWVRCTVCEPTPNEIAGR